MLDPFLGAGTVGLVAERLHRRWLGIELNSDFAEMARQRIRAARGENNQQQQSSSEGGDHGEATTISAAT